MRTGPTRAWWVVAVAALLAGLVLALLTTPAVAGPMAVAGGLCAGLFSLLVRADTSGRRVLVAVLLRDALIGAAVVLALAGWGAVAGPSVVLLVVLLVVTSPAVLRRAGRRSTEQPRVEAPYAERIASDDLPPVVSDVGPADVGALTTAAIVHLWKRTSSDLPRCRTARARASLVELRQALLDELDRRDHAGLQSWLLATPSPRNDPTRYFNRQDPPSSLAS